MDPSKLPANQLAKICCDAANADAWVEFQKRFHRTIHLAVIRAGYRAPEEIEDRAQDVFLRLVADDCKILRNFVPVKEDSIFGYLTRIAQNATHDHRRAAEADKVPKSRDRYEKDDDPYLNFLSNPISFSDSPERRILLAQFDEYIRNLMPEPITPRDYKIFWLVYRFGYTALEISRMPGINLTVKGVEASIHRTRERLREHFDIKIPLKGISGNFPINTGDR